METDQKLGLLAGVAAVLVSAVVYFNKPLPVAAGTQPAGLTAAADDRPPTVPPASVGLPVRPASYIPSARDDD